MKKKTIKIKFVGVWNGLTYSNMLLMKILNKRYNVEISEEPDYIICSVIGNPYEYTNYDAVRIFISGENYSPDFNLVDYAIGFDEIYGNERFFRFSWAAFGDPNLNFELAHKNATQNILEEKKYFCNFIYGHQTVGGERESFLDVLENYKHVESVGSFRNNREDGLTVDAEKKLQFQRKCKFTIAFESTALKGFYTEKIVYAFAANTIPIYWGDPSINEIFNSKAFINCSCFDNYEEVIAEIKRIDEDDELYLNMLKEPPLKVPDFYSAQILKLEEFLYSIFDQKKEKAYRRSRVYSPAKYDKLLQEFSIIQKRRQNKLYNWLYKLVIFK